MKKVLVLSSSPRKGGNSDLLCDAFAKGAKEAGHKVTKIRVADKKIGYCMGCYSCQKTGKCAIQDDAKEVLDAMKDADVIVFASPVYFYSVCAQLKALIDRSVVYYPTITNKDYYFLMTMAEDDASMAEGTAKAMQGFLDCYEGSTLKGTLVASGVYEKGAIKETAFLDQAYKMGYEVK